MSVSICVHAGSLQDPTNVPGLSHFLEHMLFMGSEKYPDVSDYTQYIGSHGGSCNAYTSFESTNYFFTIPKDFMEPAIDRLVQFFINPLLITTTIEKERIAVENEFKAARLVDELRYLRILQTLMHENHPASKFFNGNLVSLKENIENNKIDLRKELVEHFEKYYTSGNMSVVVIAPLPADKIESALVPYLSLIPNKDLCEDIKQIFEWEKVFNPAKFHKLINVESMKEDEVIWFSWALPPFLHQYHSKPLSFISHVIGHEGEGSLFSYLKSKRYAYSLAAGPTGGHEGLNRHFSLFTVALQLTDDGIKNHEEVFSALFHYLDLLRNCKNFQIMFRDAEMHAEIEFFFSHLQEPEEITSGIAHYMDFVKPADYLMFPYLLYEWDEENIRKILQMLTPNNVNIIHGSQKHNTSSLILHEPWFDIKHCFQDIPQTWTLLRDVDFSTMYLPRKNKFLPESLSVVPPDMKSSSSNVPKLIHSSNVAKLYYYYDDYFRLPKCSISIVIKFEAGMHEQSPRMTFYCFAFTFLFQEIIYEAEMAQINLKIKVFGNCDILFQIDGCEDKIENFTNFIFQQFASFTISKWDFENIKNKLLLKLSNDLKKQRNQMRELILHTLCVNCLDKTEIYQNLKNLTYSHFIEKFHITSLKLNIEALIAGCISSQKSLSILDTVQKSLQHQTLNSFSDICHIRYKNIPIGDNMCRAVANEPTDTQISVANVYAFNEEVSIEEETLVLFLAHLMDPMVFEVLRDEEQLGYSVAAIAMFTHHSPSIIVIVVGDATQHSTDYIDSRIESFLPKFLQYLQNMAQTDFDKKVEGFVRKINELDCSLEDVCERFLKEILHEKYMFDRKYLIADHAKDITKELVVKSLLKYVIGNGSGDDTCREHARKKLSIQVRPLTECELIKIISHSKKNNDDNNSGGNNISPPPRYKYEASVGQLHSISKPNC